MADNVSGEYFSLGKLGMDTTQFADDSKNVINRLSAIDTKAKAVWKTLNGEGTTTKKSSSGTSNTKKQEKELTDLENRTKANIIATQNFNKKLADLKNLSTAGVLSTKQYTNALKALKVQMDKISNPISVKGKNNILTGDEKGIVASSKAINTAVASSTKAMKLQSKAIDMTNISLQSNRNKLAELKNSYKSNNLSAEEYLNTLRQMKSAMQGGYNTAMTKGTTQPLTRADQGTINGYNNVQKEITGVTKAMSKLNTVQGTVELSTRKTIQTLLGWDIARQGVYFIFQYLKQGMGTLKEINDYIINIQKVTNQTDQEMKALSKSATGIATKYGRLTTDYLEALEAFARLGKAFDTKGLSELSLLMQNVGDVTAEVSQETLLAINAGFKYDGQISKLTHSLDAMNNISNNNATTILKMSEALKVSASTASASGMEFDQYIALIGTATAVTQREGSQIGNALRTMTLSIQQVNSASDQVDTDKMGKAAKAIKSIGIDMVDQDGNLRNTFDILGDIAGKWEDLSKNQRMYIAQSVGNKRQADIILGLMQNWKTVQKQYGEAINSTDSAAIENETYMKSWSAHINTFISTVISKMQELVQSDFIVGFIDFGTGAVNVISNLLPLIGALGVALQLLNKKSMTNKLFDALIRDPLSNLKTRYLDNLTGMTNGVSTYTSVTNKAGKVTDTLKSKVSAMGSAMFGAVSPLTLIVIALTAVIAAYQMYQKSIDDAAKAKLELSTSGVEEFTKIMSGAENKSTAFSAQLRKYVDDYRSYYGAIKDVGEEGKVSFSEMTASGATLTKSLDSVGMSMQDVMNSTVGANGELINTNEGLAELEDRLSNVVALYKSASKSGTYTSITKASEGISGSTTKKRTVGVLGKDIDFGEYYVSSFAEAAEAGDILQNVLQDLDDGMNIATSTLDGLNISSTQYFKTMKDGHIVLSESDEDARVADTSMSQLGATIQSIGNLPIGQQAQALRDIAQIMIDAGGDNSFLYADQLNQSADAMENYLVKNKGMLTYIQAFQKSGKFVSQDMKELGDALSVVNAAQEEAKIAADAMSAGLGNENDSSKDVIDTLTGDEFTTAMDAYIGQIEKYQDIVAKASETQFSFGQFGKADKELVNLKYDIKSLLDLYDKFKTEGNSEGMDKVESSLGDFGLYGIEEANNAYNILSASTLDLTKYTQDLSEEEQSEVSTLMDTLNAASATANGIQDLAIAYEQAKEDADGSYISQAALQDAYNQVTGAMGLQADQSAATASAILGLANANTALSDTDSARIVAQAMVSQSAKDATLVILRAKKAEIEQQINTAQATVDAANVVSTASATEAKSVASTSRTIVDYLYGVAQAQKAIKNGLDVNKLGSGAPITVQLVDQSAVNRLKQQLGTVNSLIAAVSAITITESKKGAAGAKAASADAAKAIKDDLKEVEDAIKALVDKTTDAFSKVTDSISGSFETGAITAKEALARVRAELVTLEPSYNAIKAKGESTWTDLEKATVSHYENLAGLQDTYTSQVLSNYKDSVSSVEDLQGKIVGALQKKYEAQIAARIKLLDDQRKAEVAVYDAQIKALQDQIDALNSQTEAKKKNLGSLTAKLEASRGDKSVIGIKRTAELEKEVFDLTKELQIAGLEEQKSILDEKKTNTETYYDGLLNKDSIYYDSSLALLDKALKESNVYAEANALIISGNTTAILALMTEYAPQYSGVGQLLGMSLADSMSAGISTSLGALTTVQAGVTAIATTYQAQTQSFLDFANAQMTVLDARLVAATATANAIAAAAGSTGVSTGGGGGGYSSGVSTPAVIDPKVQQIKNLQGWLNTYKSAWGGSSLNVDGVGGASTETQTDKMLDYLWSKTNNFSYKGQLRSARDSNTMSSGIADIVNSIFGRRPSIDSTFKYEEGGLSNRTGMAWLDGTPKRPERILSARQTESFEVFVNKFLPKLIGTGSSNETSVNNNKTTTVSPTIIMTNTINKEFDEKNMLDNVGRMLVGTLRKVGYK